MKRILKKRDVPREFANTYCVTKLPTLVKAVRSARGSVPSTPFPAKSNKNSISTKTNVSSAAYVSAIVSLALLSRSRGEIWLIK